MALQLSHATMHKTLRDGCSCNAQNYTMTSAGWNAVLMIKREFTHLKDAASGLPVKKISSCRWEKNGSVTGMTADETRSCYQVDAEAGRPIKPPTAVVLVDFEA